MSDWLGDISGFFGDNAKWMLPAAMVGSTVYGAMSNSNAAATQANALRAAQAQQQAGQQTAIGLQQPWINAGQAALGQMVPQLTGGFQVSPGYQWTQDEAMRAVQNSAAARGMLNSGATMKALQDRGAQLANQEYGNYFARLQSLAGLGQTGTNAATNTVGNTTNAIAGLTGNIGNVQANGQTGTASALNQGVNGLLGYYNNQNMLAALANR